MKTGSKTKKGPSGKIEAQLKSLKAASDEEVWLDLYTCYLNRMVNALESPRGKKNGKPVIHKVLDHAYKERNADPGNGQVCEKIALQDISVFPHFIDYFMKEHGRCYFPPSFNYLITLYHESGKFEEVLKVMNKASSYWRRPARQTRRNNSTPGAV